MPPGPHRLIDLRVAPVGVAEPANVHEAQILLGTDVRRSAMLRGGVVHPVDGFRMGAAVVLFG